LPAIAAHPEMLSFFLIMVCAVIMFLKSEKVPGCKVGFAFFEDLSGGE